ncbi:phage terminase small subunit P27 family [Nesterenkonia jeotgali]|uniref:P27 family predicted phage terminase small subunit n=1 Tax=Nesterenkonia jeotgali TaxID=317018 RepID=A0A839FFH3_9MICC|nr:phage terminase small subunit P27 family [Nesterenkonia jeotgali]MBA8920428.1 P27 family predicted phage terminase small subunit [Nesterenkonia jeotgali]
MTDSVQMPPGYLPEPEWTQVFPAMSLKKKPQPPEPREGESAERFENREQRYENQMDRYEAQVTAKRMAETSRKVAEGCWRRVVPILERAIGLSEVDMDVLQDYCVTVARIVVAEQEVSRQGMLVPSNRGGTVKNPLLPALAQYRGQIKTYIGQLGLSPAARVGLPGKPDDDDDDDLFDA